MATGVRTVPSSLATALTQDTMTLALLLDITRRDGTVLGFTTVDKDIVYAGITYKASPSMSISSIRQTAGTGIDNIDITGAIDSNLILESDLFSGLYSNASLRLYVCDYNNIAGGTTILLTGFIGQTTYEDGKFIAEFRSLGQRTSAKCGNIISQTCRVAKLGNALCNPGGTFQGGITTMSSYQFTRNLSAISTDRYTLTFASDSNITGYYDYGKLYFTTGPAAGAYHSREIKSHTLVSGQAVLILQEAFPFVPIVGNTAILEAGCNRAFATCQSKFSNYYNFRGEPFVPGNDVLKRSGR